MSTGVSEPSHQILLADLALSKLPEAARKDIVGFVSSETGIALEYYWAAVALESRSDTSDSVVEAALVKALQGDGHLVFAEQPEAYLDAVMRKARLHIKYKRWQEARSLLSLVAQLQSRPPGWVSNYLGKLLFETDPKFAFEQPEHVLEKLVIGSKEVNYQQHSMSVFRDFLETAKQWLLLSGDESEAALSDFRAKVKQFLDQRSFSLQHATPENGGASTLVLERYGSIHLADETESIPGHSSETYNDQSDELRARVIELEKLVDGLQSRVDDLTTENIRLYVELDFLKEESEENHDDESFDDKSVVRPPPVAIDRLKILVMGGLQLKTKEVLGIAKRFGLEKRNADFIGYEGSKKLNIESWRYNCPYDGILIGPVPHSTAGASKYSSIVERLKVEEGFPPAIDVRTRSGELKVTKTSLRTSLEALLNKIGAVDPELASL